MVSGLVSMSDAGHLRHLIYDLLGENGIRLYAERVGIHRNTVSRALCDRKATLSRTLDLVFSLLLSAREAGGDPHDLLGVSRAGTVPLLDPVQMLLGKNAVDRLADRLSRTNRAVLDGLTRRDSHLWQHLEISVNLLEYIVSKGGCASAAVGRRIEPELRSYADGEDVSFTLSGSQPLAMMTL